MDNTEAVERRDVYPAMTSFSRFLRLVNGNEINTTKRRQVVDRINGKQIIPQLKTLKFRLNSVKKKKFCRSFKLRGRVTRICCLCPTNREYSKNLLTQTV